MSTDNNATTNPVHETAVTLEMPAWEREMLNWKPLPEPAVIKRAKEILEGVDVPDEAKVTVSVMQGPKPKPEWPQWSGKDCLGGRYITLEEVNNDDGYAISVGCAYRREGWGYIVLMSLTLEVAVFSTLEGVEEAVERLLARAKKVWPY